MLGVEDGRVAGEWAFAFLSVLLPPPVVSRKWLAWHRWHSSFSLTSVCLSPAVNRQGSVALRRWCLASALTTTWLPPRRTNVLVMLWGVQEVWLALC